MITYAYINKLVEDAKQVLPLPDKVPAHTYKVPLLHFNAWITLLFIKQYHPVSGAYWEFKTVLN